MGSFQNSPCAPGFRPHIFHRENKVSFSHVKEQNLNRMAVLANPHLFLQRYFLHVGFSVSFRWNYSTFLYFAFTFILGYFLVEFPSHLFLIPAFALFQKASRWVAWEWHFISQHSHIDSHGTECWWKLIMLKLADRFIKSVKNSIFPTEFKRITFSRKDKSHFGNYLLIICD